MIAPIVAPTIAVIVRPPSLWLLALTPLSPILLLLGVIEVLLLEAIEVLVLLPFWLNGSFELKECVPVIWPAQEVSLLSPDDVHQSAVPY